jgi:hypothetical protein
MLFSAAVIRADGVVLNFAAAMTISVEHPP